jgi:membrane fusion protein (multidrug efflux system)
VRYFLPILALLVLVGSLAGVKFAQISSLMKAGEAFAKAGPPPEAVSTDVSRELGWEGTLSAVGSIAAARGVVVSNESPGVVKRIAFESGNLAKPGQVLVELDTDLERAQLANAQAQKELAEQSVVRSRGLAERSVVTASQLENDEARYKAALADVAALEAQIARKVVRAPFAGRLGIRAVNLGQYLSPGTSLTTLESLDSVFVDFALPQQALMSLQTGLSVRVLIGGAEGAQGFVAEGQISAVDPSVDPATRSIRVRASVPNAEQKLRPGMFANVSVVLPKRAAIVAVPATAVVHAPYGDSVFLVEPLKEPTADAKIKQVRQQFVRLGEERGDFVAVVEGVKAGQEVVVAGAFKLRNGAKIAINNELKPDAQAEPRPENR